MRSSLTSWAGVLWVVLATPGLSAEEPIELEPLSIHGNAGQPKTLYIAPWKRVGSPMQGGRFRSALDPDPVPLEREQFRRELELRERGYSVD